jgi:hypothetical protein
MIAGASAALSTRRVVSQGARTVFLNLSESAFAAIAIATLAVVGLVVFGRRAADRARDLGIVSHQWIVQHRDPPSVDSR